MADPGLVVSAGRVVVDTRTGEPLRDYRVVLRAGGKLLAAIERMWKLMAA